MKIYLRFYNTIIILMILLLPLNIALAGDYSHPGNSQASLQLSNDAVDAGCEGDVQKLKEIIQKGAGINAQQEGGGMTILMCAAGMERVEMVKYLLDNGADVNRQSVAGMTALMFAASYGYLDITKILISHGASKELREKSGYTAYMIAREKRKYDVAYYLERGSGLEGNNFFPELEDEDNNIENMQQLPDITRAFGIYFGSVFDPSWAIGQKKSNDGTILYQFKPKETFRSFSKYFVSVTPITHQVYSVMGTGLYEEGKTCEHELNQLREILRRKYGNPGQQLATRMFNAVEIMKGRDNLIKTYCSYPAVFRRRNYRQEELWIVYLDTELQKIGWSEQIEIDERELYEKADESSAL